MRFTLTRPQPDAPRSVRVWPLTAAALALALTPLISVALAAWPLARHMSVHIVEMNLLAPAIALALDRGRSGRLVLAMAVQIVLLWGWHAPSVFHAAMVTPALEATMHLSLTLGAVWFWREVAATDGAARWRAILALLITGKLFCLLGALLVFAPRPLLLEPLSAASLADQQLAGLIMLTACPATYVLAGVVIAARWVFGLEKGVATA